MACVGLQAYPSVNVDFLFTLFFLFGILHWVLGSSVKNGCRCRANLALANRGNEQIFIYCVSVDFLLTIGSCLYDFTNLVGQLLDATPSQQVWV